ncbi:MAG TPA: ABC transporter substrate-binding protein [Candidatus Methylomirabilis sp.]|jgi:putative ABC transport system substrate-binding protein
MSRGAGPIVILALGILVAPLTADAQQPAKVYRIGVLASAPPTTPEVSRLWEAFRQGLGERGWVEGQNVVIESRWSEGQVERFPALAAEIVRLNVDLIFAVGTPGALAAKQATSVIPIVMAYVGDPVEQGLVASLARPGGNVTGLTFLVGPEIAGKYLELLKEAVPKASRVAVLLNPTGRFSAILKQTQAAAQALAVKLQPIKVRSPNELEGAFAAMARGRANALLVLPHPFTFAHARRIADLAAKSRLPAVYAYRESVEGGGLMAYAANAPDMFRRAASYVDKILRGAKPADLPVEQPMRFELVINLKTAKALGLTIPQSVLFRADKVIQ